MVNTERVVKQQIAVATKIEKEAGLIKQHIKTNDRENYSYISKEQIGPFKKGERLIITNNYLGLRGTVGVVESSNRKYIATVDSNKTPHKRAHTNLRRVSK